MATTDVCSNFHAKQHEDVNFTNGTGIDCTLTATGTWPFVDGPPFDVPVGGSKTKVKSKVNLPDGTYPFNASCCPEPMAMPKSVTVP